MRTCSVHLLSLLAAAGCVPSAADLDTVAKERDLVEDADGFSGYSPTSRLELSVGRDGVALLGQQGSFHLSFARWGPPDATFPLAPVERLVPGCGEAEAGPCSDAVDRVRDGVIERWHNGEAGLEQRWEIGAPPSSADALALDVLVSGAALALSDDGASVWILSDGGGLYRYSGLAAWDASGQARAASFEVVGQTIRMVVETPPDLVWPLTVDPVLSPADWTGTGTASSAAYGFSVAGAGHVNADDYADVLIGAPAASCTSPVAGAGKVYVIYGSESGLGAETASTTLSAPASAACYGYSVAGVGDVNHDGYDDVAVGAPGTTSYTGTVYFYHGGESGLDTAVKSTLTGPATSSCFGGAIAGGDIIRDTYSDVAVGAYCYSSSKGWVGVYKGSSTGVATTATSTLTGSSGSWFGGSLDVGDVTRDKYADVVVGASHASSNRGEVRVYKGSSSGVTYYRTLTYPSGTYFLGSSVAILDDATGDGYADIAASNAYYSGSSSYGRVYLFKGSGTGPATTSSSYVTDGATSTRYGTPIADAGDLNDDGCSDLVVGAAYADSNNGRVYVYEGCGSDFTLVNTLTSAYTGAKMGLAVAGVGDTDGLYNADILIGAPYADLAVGGSSYTDNGVVELYLGCIDGDSGC